MLIMRNGDYVPRGNRLRTAEGDEALLQRVLLKLTARRGKFPFMEEFGSRLWTLGQLKPGERQAVAEQYVAEALAGEDLRIDSVTLTEDGQGHAALRAALSVSGREMTVETVLE